MVDIQYGTDSLQGLHVKINRIVCLSEFNRNICCICLRRRERTLIAVVIQLYSHYEEMLLLSTIS